MSIEPTPTLSPTRYFWLRLLLLAMGLAALVTAHVFTRHLDDSVARTRPTMTAVIVVAVASVAVVARSVHVIVTSAFSDAYRVFRARHLFFCFTLLFASGAAAAIAMVLHHPFDKLFAHGQITGEDVIDVGIVITSLFCLMGAGVALTGAWDALHEERNWHRTLHLHSRRRI